MRALCLTNQMIGRLGGIGGRLFKPRLPVLSRAIRGMNRQ